MPTPKQLVIQNLALIDDMSDLQDLNDHFKTAWDRVRSQAVKDWSVGDEVEFDLRGGKVARGVIEKRNRKTLGVKVTHIDGEERPYAPGYNVPGTMLRSVA